jgi:hypothetical protein
MAKQNKFRGLWPTGSMVHPMYGRCVSNTKRMARTWTQELRNPGKSGQCRELVTADRGQKGPDCEFHLLTPTKSKKH